MNLDNQDIVNLVIGLIVAILIVVGIVAILIVVGTSDSDKNKKK